MSTLVEIENAVVALPSAQQENLLIWLQSLLSRRSPGDTGMADDRQAWLARLAKLRQRGGTGRPGTPLQQIMDDLRRDAGCLLQ